MANQLHHDGLGNKGITARCFAERHGLSTKYIIELCRKGRIFGARKHVLTNQWWIYPPAKFLCVVKAKRVNTSTPMRSTSLENAQA